MRAVENHPQRRNSGVHTLNLLTESSSSSTGPIPMPVRTACTEAKSDLSV